MRVKPWQHYPTLKEGTLSYWGALGETKVSSTKLSFNPAIGQLSTNSFNSTSDARRKYDVVGVSGIKVVEKLRGVEFKWVGTSVKSSGVIAQEVESVLPHLVSTDSEGNKSVNYAGLSAYLFEAVEELSARIHVLENK